MSLRLFAKKINIKTGNPLIAVLNSKDAASSGIVHGNIVRIAWKDVCLHATVDVTDSDVQPGEVGLFEEVWNKYKISDGIKCYVELPEKTDSIEYIKKKLLGQKLSEEELEVIMADISQRKIRDIEIAYFMSTFFSTGFDDDEVLWAAKGMAKYGDILDFKSVAGENSLVVDKHSIGGIAGKGVTPIIVPILASLGLIVPNTSTRAITTPAGTADILEVLFPVSLSKEEVMSVVKKTGACLIWGGALDLAPADDILINVEHVIRIQSYQKMMMSIVAKKIAMGVSNILIDIPYGKGTKVENPDDIDMFKSKFVKIFGQVGINAQVFTRFVKAPDSLGIGPVLEARDLLRVYERHAERPISLEKLALEMSGKVLEMSGRAETGKGYDMAKTQLDNGKAYDKFWEIALAQGAKQKIKSDSLEIGSFTADIVSNKTGKINFINNKEIVRITRELGNPYIKEAGLYFAKTVGDKVEKGEKVLTVIATSQNRLDAAVSSVDIEKMVELV